jgi:hypothetical protein
MAENTQIWRCTKHNALLRGGGGNAQNGRVAALFKRGFKANHHPRNHPVEHPHLELDDKPSCHPPHILLISQTPYATNPPPHSTTPTSMYTAQTHRPRLAASLPLAHTSAQFLPPTTPRDQK